MRNLFPRSLFVSFYTRAVLPLPALWPIRANHPGPVHPRRAKKTGRHIHPPRETEREREARRPSPAREQSRGPIFTVERGLLARPSPPSPFCLPDYAVSGTTSAPLSSGLLENSGSVTSLAVQSRAVGGFLVVSQARRRGVGQGDDASCAVFITRPRRHGAE